MKRVFVGAIALVLIAGAVFFWIGNRMVNQSVTAFRQDAKTILLPQALPVEALADVLLTDSVITQKEAFLKVAELKKFTTAKPGRYLIQQGASNNLLINRFRSGDQDPVRVTFNATRTHNELAGRVAQQLMLDSAALAKKMRDPNTAAQFGFSPEAFKSMFIPNTYEFWWNTDPDAFINRMADEFKRFWNEDRKAKAAKLKLTQSEVTTLASIVSAETAKRDEAPRVAGLYLNRLRVGMPMQADPTLIYAHNDFTITRVLNIHKEIDSPYNTYRSAGLPPGPINFPDATYIDAVLNPENHDYIFMCAKADFSGYHHFSKTLSQHNAYASEYQREISKRR